MHNLKGIDAIIPRDRLVVITGLSGSGKSSLAFDTIHAEGQRRYIETFNAYARQFLGAIERPDVDMITGLSPRSTVGTVTEAYDLLRLLYARVADAFSYATGEPMVRYTDQQIIDLVGREYAGKEVLVLAPLVRGRKGHYRELFEQLLRQGFLRARADGEVIDLTARPRLDRYKAHDIELVVDRLRLGDGSGKRLADTVLTALKHGKGSLVVVEAKGSHAPRFLSRHLMCPTTGMAYEEPEPNLFSFNSPYGACPACSGLGQVTEVALDKIVPDRRKSIRKGAILPIGAAKGNWLFKQIEAVLETFGHDLDTPVEDMDEVVLAALLNGMDEPLKVTSGVGLSDRTVQFEGIIPYILEQAEEGPRSSQKWASGFTHMVTCPECGGARLKRTALHFRIDGKSIADLARMPVSALHAFMQGLDQRLPGNKAVIAKEPVKEIAARLSFLIDVGLDYLTLDRSARSLSGGEAQRIRLATQIGSQLTGVLYVLDEPTVGLHPRDNDRLIRTLQAMRDLGNT
ncbi:MAG: excinuclease ABC subunit UvrA, partial [Flavobacteriales bacterium]